MHEHGNSIYFIRDNMVCFPKSGHIYDNRDERLVIKLWLIKFYMREMKLGVTVNTVTKLNLHERAHHSFISILEYIIYGKTLPTLFQEKIML